MKKLFSLLLAIIASVGTFYASIKVNIDDIYYNLNESELTAEVTSGTYGAYSGNIIIPASIVYENVPYNVTSIGEFAFQGCNDLVSLTISEGITDIGKQAIYNCPNLTSITLPNSVVNIGESAFQTCSTLRSVVLSDNLKSIGKYAFKSCYMLKSITIPGGVATIGYQTFWECNSLESITISDGVQIIGTYAFAKCPKLTSITIPNSVSTIGGYAFMDCSALTSVIIGNSVSNIGNLAFQRCSNLTSIECHAIEPPSLENSVFNSVNTSIPLYVPYGSIDAYKAADQWKDFTNIQAIPGTEPCILASGTCGAQGDNLTWELSCDGVLTISGEGRMADYDWGNQPWMDYREQIKELVVEDGVSSIGEYAFNGCVNMTSATIGDDVFYISDEAFLSAIHLKTVRLGKNVNTIGSLAFCSCSELSSINLPYSVGMIGGGAFQDCISLTSVVIPDNVIYLERTVFANCEKLSNVTLSSNLETIGENCFQGCEALQSIQLPNSLTKIEAVAFIGCRNLQSIQMSNNLVNIGYGAFSDCSSLENISIPKSVTDIGEAVFMGCDGLTTVIVEEGNPVYDSRNNCNAIIKTAINELQAGCHTTSIPVSVTSIGKDAFYNISTLTSVNIQENITSIGAYAFTGTGLSIITFPATITKLSEHVVGECQSLKALIIPESVTEVGSWVFANDAELDSVVCYAVTPPAVNEWTFEYFGNQQSCRLYVPAESIDAYKAANGWKEFDIKPITSETGTIVIGDGEDEDLNDNTGEKPDIIVEPGGELNINASGIGIGVLIITADGIHSGEVHHHGHGVTADHIYIEYILNPFGPTANPNKWYAFAVPFEVDIAGGISRTCDDKELVSGTDFLFMKYNGLARALHGKGWTKMESHETLMPGQFYMLGIDGNCNRWRFEKKAERPFEGDTHILFSEYPSSIGRDAGWNSLGNTRLEYMDFTITGINYVTTYNNQFGKYTTSLISEMADLFVGQPFFIQTTGSGSFDFVYNSSLHMPALYAPSQTSTPLMHFTLTDETQCTGTDHMFLTLHEDATPTYTIGRDVARMTKDCKTAAQLWCTMSDGTELSAHGISLPETEAVVPVTLFAPTKGEYLLNMSGRTVDDFVAELLFQGTYLATLFEGQPVTLDLNAGMTTDYSLRIRRKLPTDISNVQSGNAQSTKVLIDDHLYIFRAGHIYDAQGKKVK